MTQNRWIAALILACVALGGYFTWTRLRANSTGSAVDQSGKRKAPAFVLKDSRGQAVSLAERFKDSVVVVHFWASWCAPCLPEIPEVLDAARRLQKDSSGRPIYWVLITEDETWEKAHTVLKEDVLPPNAFLLIDEDTRVSDQFGSYQFPETYVLNRGHSIEAKWIGAQEWGGEWGKTALARMESLSLNR